MANMLRAGSRSYLDEQKRKERKRALVLAALAERQTAQADDRLLADVIAAVPRTTPQRIAEVMKQLRRKDESEANSLERALEHCEELAQNLNGMDPKMLWTEPVRMVWMDCIDALTAQTSRWKCTPLVLVHPFAGKITVMTSLCGKHQANNEYNRMRAFANELRNGIEVVLDEIHPVRDDKTGMTLPMDETRDILLEISQENNGDGELSEDEDENGSNQNGDNNDFDDLNRVVERVSEDWSRDIIESSPEAMKAPNAPKRTPNPFTSTPPNVSPIESASSSFSSPPAPFETPLSSTQRPGSVAVSIAKDHKVHRTLLFPPTAEYDHRPAPPSPTPRRVSFQPDWQATAPMKMKSNLSSGSSHSSLAPPPSPMRPPSELADAFPNGYSVIPLKSKKTGRKSEPKRPSETKKRSISSPNYPSNKHHRLDQQEAAISEMRQVQADQTALLRNLADQIGTLTFNMRKTE